jgi:orotate phosphoribosyltransferase
MSSKKNRAGVAGSRKKMVEELAMVLLKVKALQIGTFTLASGKLSSYYIDMRAVPSFPGAYRYVIDCYVELIRDDIGLSNFDAIAGVPTAGLVYSSPIALELGKPMIYVRKEEKDYGRKKRIEGSIKPGWKVLVLDDVITTGMSKLPAIDAIREEGGEVLDVAVLIDRLEGGRANLKKAGAALHSLTDVMGMIQALHKNEAISDEEMQAIKSQTTVRRQ